MEGIETSPTAVEKPQVLCTHDQHATNYVRLMMEAGMNVPMGEDRVAPLITEVKPLISLFPSPTIPPLILLSMTISSIIIAFLCSPQALQKIQLANHIHSLAELLHADAAQLLEVALLGTPTA